jgi:hypothetical protein
MKIYFGDCGEPHHKPFHPRNETTEVSFMFMPMPLSQMIPHIPFLDKKIELYPLSMSGTSL